MPDVDAVTLNMLGVDDGLAPIGAVCGIDGVCTVPGQDAAPVVAAHDGADGGVPSRPAGPEGLDSLVGRRVVSSAADMEDLGRTMGRLLRAGDLVVLTGALGAGKTTLTRGIGAGLGVRGPIQSPTFVIARTHPSLVDGAPLVHADAYRLASAIELDDLDIDVDGAVVVIEWGKGKAEGLRDTWWEVELVRDAAGHGLDCACEVPDGQEDQEDQDAPDPRIVTITRRP